MKVSCVMPVCGRLDFTRKAVDYFFRQTEADSELIIVDDWDEPTRTVYEEALDIPTWKPRIRYVRGYAAEMPAGPKRNMGAAAAIGEYILHWDDDDWYAPTRIEHQISRLEGNDDVDITWMPNAVSFYINTGSSWVPRPDSHWLTNGTVVLGGSLAYKRHVWDAGVRYENRTYADEENFCRDARKMGFKQERDVTPEQWMIIRHDGHGRKHRPGPSMMAGKPTYVPESDLEFYRMMGGALL